MKYGVVIVTYNRLELLKECIENCIRQTIPFEKIIIVNNCSTDGTDEYLQQYKADMRFVISEQTENLGGAGGFRVGLELAGKEDLDWVLIIDDDAMIAEDYIQKCDRVIRRYPNVVACSGTVYTDGKIQTIHRRVIANRTLYLEKNVPLSAYERKCFRYDLATFCGLMVRADILANVNAAHLNHKTVLPSGEQKGFFMRMGWRTYYGHRNRLDAVKTHCSKVTQLVIYAEFMVFIACGAGMCLIPKYHRQGKYITRMLWDAWMDGKQED